jgi:hypothetical protein
MEAKYEALYTELQRLRVESVEHKEREQAQNKKCDELRELMDQQKEKNVRRKGKKRALKKTLLDV